MARQAAERPEAPAPAEAAEEEVDFEADEPEEVVRSDRVHQRSLPVGVTGSVPREV